MSDVLAPSRSLTPGDGIELAAFTAGPADAPLALLVHANSLCATTLTELAQPLAATHRVVAFDIRGHGRSSKPADPDAYAWERFADDLVGVAKQLGPVDLVACHSFTGSCALVAGARAPGLWRRLVLMDPVLLPADPERAAALAKGTREKAPRTFPGPIDEAVAALRRNRLFTRCTDASIRHYVEDGMELGADGTRTLRCSRDSEAAVYERRLGGERLVEASGAGRVPTLLLYAEERRVADLAPVERRYAEQVVAASPGSTLEEVAGVGHFMPLEAPERTAELIRAWSR